MLRSPVVLRFRHIWSREVAFLFIAVVRASLISLYLLISLMYPNFPHHRFGKVLQAPAAVLSLPPLAIGRLSPCLRSPALISPIRPGCDAIVDPRWLVRRHIWTTAVVWVLTFYGLRLAIWGLRLAFTASA